MRVRMVPEGTVWGAGECLGGADGHGVPGALLGHSMAFRGALASASRIMGCDSPRSPLRIA